MQWMYLCRQLSIILKKAHKERYYNLTLKINTDRPKYKTQGCVNIIIATLLICEQTFFEF